MKLRFGIDAAARDGIRARLDTMCAEPPVGRRLSYVYMDTPDDALASRGIALRFRRSAAVGIPSPRRRWLKQEIWPKGESGSIKKLGIAHLKQRLDATFTVRIERWTWVVDDKSTVIALDATAIDTGRAEDRFSELRIVCKGKQAEAATTLAVELGAMHVSSTRARERGQALLRRS